VTTLHTYRFSALVLAFLFCLFNIGLPVLIAACPVMGSVSSAPSCCSSRHADAASLGTVSLTINCCRTQLAAERNRTEFIGERQSPGIALCPGGPGVAGNSVLPAAFLRETPSSYISPSPPVDDIPIFTSSLLI
jgi:hypothetical protein